MSLEHDTEKLQTFSGKIMLRIKDWGSLRRTAAPRARIE
jgi:hypothetical protein